MSDYPREDHALLHHLDSAHSGHTVNSDIDFKQYKAIALICDHGSTLPATPVVGQWFLHVLTGRNILCMYDGLAWTSIISFGVMTLYVSTTGTNDLAHGTGTGTAAFLTVQYAINIIPSLFAGSITINIGSGSFPETVSIQGKNPTGSYSISIFSTLTQLTSATASSGDQGAAGVLPTVSVSGTPWTEHAYQNKMIRFDAATTTVALKGVSRIIDDNTNNTLTLIGWMPGTPVNTDTFKIYDWGTVITKVSVSNGQIGINFYDTAFSAGTGIAATSTGWASIGFYNCSLVVTSGIGFYVVNFSLITLGSGLHCDLVSAPTGTGGYVLSISNCSIQNVKMFAHSLVLGPTQFGRCTIYDSVFDGDAKSANHGIDLTGSVYVYFGWVGTANPKTIIRNCNVGLYVSVLSGANNAVAAITYSNNNTNSVVDAASFGYIS